MGYALRIGDGVTYVNLADGVTAGPLAYTPKHPPIGAEWAEAVGRDGADMVYASYGNVTESYRGVLLGTTATIRATIQALHRHFQTARLYQAGHRGGNLQPIYVEFQPDGDATWYRSPLYHGAIELDEDALDYMWLAGQIDVTVSWARAFYWEGQPAVVNLSNGHGGPTSAFLRVYGCDDGTHDNWVDIDASSVAGDLPSPARLEIRSQDSTAQKTTDIFVGHSVWMNPPSSFAHQYEAESATGGSASGGAASGGSYKVCSWTAATETLLLTWSIGSATLNIANGGYFKALLTLHARPGSVYSDLRLRLRLKPQGRSEVLYDGAAVLYDSTSTQIDLGTVRLPPSWIGDTPVAAFGIDVELYGTRANGASTTIQPDFISFLPTDGFRHYAPIASASLSQNDRLVDDMPNRALYWRNNFGSSLVTYQGYGRTILLWPNRTQRLYFLVDTDLGTVNPGLRELNVTVSYRPRRISL